jgi:hypothetical protein
MTPIAPLDFMHARIGTELARLGHEDRTQFRRAIYRYASACHALPLRAVYPQVGDAKASRLKIQIYLLAHLG